MSAWYQSRFLDHSDLGALLSSRSMLADCQVDRVKRTLRKMEEFPEKFARPEQTYAQQAGIFMLSGSSRADRFSECGIWHREWNRHHGKEVWRKRRCGYWQVCTPCGFAKQMSLLRKFLPVIANLERPPLFATLSLERCLNFEPCTEDDLQTYWMAGQWALRRLHQAGLIQGAIIVEELHVESYYPRKLVLPHIHAVVISDVDASKIESRLYKEFSRYDGREWLSQKRRWSSPLFPVSMAVAPSVKVKELPTLEARSVRLCYLTWSTDLVTAYMLDMERLRDPSPDVIWRLNEAKDQVIEGWEYWKEGRQQFTYLGDFHSSSSGFTGLSKDERDCPDNRSWVNIRLREMSTERRRRRRENQQLGDDLEEE